MLYILYFLIAIGATTVGSLTGMGGGVIIKPLMDVLHHFDVETIGVLSSITGLFHGRLSFNRKQILAKSQIPFQIASLCLWDRCWAGIWAGAAAGLT